MRIDFKEVREQYPIADVCTLLGVALKKSGKSSTKLEGQCPICHRNALKVTPSIQRWWCFGGCRKGGDALQLVMEAKKLPDVHAAQYIVKNLGRR